jgi:cephalosporin-C deacetylase
LIKVARTDLSIVELVDYRPAVAEPADFDTFWDQTISETKSFDLDVRLHPVKTPYRTVDIHDASFRGFAGDRINAWLLGPRQGQRPRPAVVEFVGYNGGRDLPGASLYWASAGYIHLLVDTRGQGSAWGGGGDTRDPHGSGPHAPGFLTQGIEEPKAYYYRRVFTDALRAVEVVRSLPDVDASRVAVQGISQGGGIALAAAGLAKDLVAVMPDLPFLCHFQRAVDICEQAPYTEITRYLSVHRGAAPTAFNTLSYFDAVNFAKRATAPALFSVALMDQVCPPSTVYAAYNAYAGAKDMVVYAFNDHEGGLGHQRLAQISWLNRLIGFEDSSNAVGNFCFEASLAYQRGERPRRVNDAGLTC